MKWTLILFLLAFSSRHVGAQDFTSSLNKNKIQNLGIGAHDSLINFLKNEMPLNVSAGDKVSYIKTLSETNGAKLFLIPQAGENSTSSDKSISKIFVKFYGGYGIFTPGSYKVTTSFSLRDTTVKTETKKGLGSGLRFGGGFGLVMNDFLDIGIDAEYHKASWTENSLNVYSDVSNYNEKNSGMDYTTISITPYVIFKALAKPKYFVYNKLGILLTLPFTLGTSQQSTYATNQSLDNNINTYTQNVYSTTNENYKISLGVGLNVALGVNMKVNERSRIFCELFGNYSALSPTHSVKTDYAKRFASLSFNSDNSEPLIVKQISTTTTNTTYRKGESLPVDATYESKPPVIEDDYTVTDVTINTLAYKFTINMAVLGVNLGFIYRF